jgi:hypothetical protein
MCSFIPWRSDQKCEYLLLSPSSSITTSSWLPCVLRAAMHEIRPRSRPSSGNLIVGEWECDAFLQSPNSTALELNVEVRNVASTLAVHVPLPSDFTLLLVTPARQTPPEALYTNTHNGARSVLVHAADLPSLGGTKKARHLLVLHRRRSRSNLCRTSTTIGASSSPP